MFDFDAGICKSKESSARLAVEMDGELTRVERLLEMIHVDLPLNLCDDGAIHGLFLVSAERGGGGGGGEVY